MSDPLGIPAGAIRAIWVFAIDLPEEALPGFAEEVYPEDDDAPVQWPLRDALGLTRLDHDFIEVFQAEKLSDYGFARYLTEANGMDEASVAPDTAMLDALTGPVLLVHSSALGPDVNRLAPVAPLRLIGRYAESVNMTLRPPLSAEAASGIVAEPPKQKPSDAAMSGRIAALALLVLFALVGLMIWIGG